MKMIGSVLGLLVLGLGFYIYSMQAQTRDVAEFCSTFPEGSRAESLFAVAQSFSGTLMASDKFADYPGPQQFVYCAPITMCDVSCSLEIKEGVVIKSEYRSL